MIKFSVASLKKEESNVILLGLNYTRDSKKVLKQMRKASYFVEPFDIHGKNLLENAKIFDAGNLKIKKFEKISEIFLKIRNEGKIPLMISRGHLPTFYITRNLKEEKLIIFDAHADCKDKYIDEIIAFDALNEKKKEFNGSTWLRRLLESSKIEVLLIGLRSFDEDELEFLEEKRVKFFTPLELRKKPQALGEIKKFTKNSKIYISLDFDVFDPSIFPAVDYPEPGGLSYFDFVEIMEAIKGKLIGSDVCCFKPIEDNLMSEFLAIKSIFHILSKI
jgi:agmatinase